MKQPLPITLPPGVVANSTDEQASGRWRSANQVRWVDGALQPIGGWGRAFEQVLDGVPRALHAWTANDLQRRVAIGTNTKLYAWSGSSVADITPAGLTAGRAYSAPGLGYGAGPYGRGKYGRKRIGSGITLAARVWSLDNWGQDLIACPNDNGAIYRWDLFAAQAAALLGAPTARGVAVTDERHLVAFAAGGDPRKIQWCKREDLAVWAPSTDPLNNSGDLRMNTNGVYRAHAKIRGGTLILTDTDAHLLSFVGRPFTYGVQRLAGNCGCVGPGGVAVAGGAAYWLASNGFWVFDGAVRRLPCTIEALVPDDTRRLNDGEVSSGVNFARGEVWWFYTDRAGARRYATYSFREGWWATGLLDRTAMTEVPGDDRPIAASPAGRLYQHEFGWLDDGAPRAAGIFATTAPLKIGTGDREVVVTMIESDTVVRPEGFNIEVAVRDKPNSVPTARGPYSFTRPDGAADCRFTGRRASFTVRGADDVGWKLGSLVLHAGQGARR